MDSTEPNHAQPSLSTARGAQRPTPSALANVLRYQPGLAKGHVESLFLKGNSPDGQRAFWIKYTVLVPAGRPHDAVAELWAIAFRRDTSDPRARLVANKQTFPIAQTSIASAPFRLQLPTAELSHGFARGQLGADQRGPRLRWELRYTCPEQEFRPYPARLYTMRFPRSKTLTPAPDSVLSGFFEVEGERWNIDGFRAAQGHNWGESHADAYAWVHCNAFTAQPGSAPCQRVWLEGLTGRVRVGPVRTPWLSAAAICIDGQLFRFDGLKAMLTRKVGISAQRSSLDDTRRYEVTLEQAGARLHARFWTDPTMMAGLTYQDPDGATLACLNSKLAYGEVVLTANGRTWSLTTDQAALELGTRQTDHGITMLV